MLETYDIANLPKERILQLMWERVKPARFLLACKACDPDFHIPEWTVPSPEVISSYIDYYNGRCIKTDLSGDTVDPYYYDLEVGEGSLDEIIDQVRSEVSPTEYEINFIKKLAYKLVLYTNFNYVFPN